MFARFLPANQHWVVLMSPTSDLITINHKRMWPSLVDLKRDLNTRGLELTRGNQIQLSSVNWRATA